MDQKYRMSFSGGLEPEGAGPSPLNSVSDSNMCPTENRHFLPKKSISLSLSVSLEEHFFISYCLFLSIFLSLSSILFSLQIFPLSHSFLFLFFFSSLFCHLFSVRHYLVSDARAFPGRPGRPAKYALDFISFIFFSL